MNKTIRIFKKLFLYTFSVLLLLLITGYIYLYVLPKGPAITETAPIHTGKDSFVMYAYKESKKKSIKVWTYKPQDWNNKDKIVFVMHGGGRNAEDYLEAWITIAKENKFLIIAPEFENKFSNYTTNDYQEGNLFTFFGTKNPKEQWAYSVIENIFDHLKAINSITNKSYSIFGHSAGGQFVHRMVMLMPEARIETAIAANAGFYTLPNDELKYPYGLAHTGLHLKEDLPKSYTKNLVILLGELDNNSSLGTFRMTPLAMEQGADRLSRGTNFYNANKRLKNEVNVEFNWRIDMIENVGHDYKNMSENAVKWLSE